MRHAHVPNRLRHGSQHAHTTRTPSLGLAPDSKRQGGVYGPSRAVCTYMYVDSYCVPSLGYIRQSGEQNVEWEHTHNNGRRTGVHK